MESVKDIKTPKKGNQTSVLRQRMISFFLRKNKYDEFAVKVNVEGLRRQVQFYYYFHHMIFEDEQRFENFTCPL